MASQKTFRLEDLSKIKKEDLVGRISLLIDEDEYFHDRVVKFLKDEFLGDNYSDFSVFKFDSIDSFDDLGVVSNCSLIRENRLCILDNVFSSNKDENKRILEYVKELSSKDDSLIFLFIEKDRKYSKSISSKFKEGLNIFSFERLKGSSVQSFVKYQFKKAGKDISNSEITYLIDILGYNHRDSKVSLQNILNYVDIISSYSNDKSIKKSDIDANVEKSLDTHAFTLLDSIYNDRKNAYSILEDLLYRGESEYRLLALMLSNLELTLKVIQLKKKGHNHIEISKILGVHEFRVKKALSLALNLTDVQIINSIIYGYEVDENIKYGILTSKLAIELYMSKLFVEFR